MCFYSTFQVLLVPRWSAGATGWIPRLQAPSLGVSRSEGGVSEVLGLFRLRWRRVREEVEEEASHWLLALQDGSPVSRRWEGEPPLGALAPLGGGGRGAGGPARRGSAVGRAGRSQEAGVQRRSHRRARQVIAETSRVRVPKELLV